MATKKAQPTFPTKLVIDEIRTVEFEFGWILYPTPIEYLETRDISKIMGGGLNPIIVDRFSGKVFEVFWSSPVSYTIDMYSKYRDNLDVLANMSMHDMTWYKEPEKYNRENPLGSGKLLFGDGLK